MSTPSLAVSEPLLRLTPAWFQTVLRSSGSADVIVVEAVPEPLAFTGAIADIARFQLTYDPRSPSGPSSLIAKIRSSTPPLAMLDLAMGLSEREARFYSTLACTHPARHTDLLPRRSQRRDPAPAGGLGGTPRRRPSRRPLR